MFMVTECVLLLFSPSAIVTTPRQTYKPTIRYKKRNNYLQFLIFSPSIFIIFYFHVSLISDVVSSSGVVTEDEC